MSFGTGGPRLAAEASQTALQCAVSSVMGTLPVSFHVFTRTFEALRFSECEASSPVCEWAGLHVHVWENTLLSDFPDSVTYCNLYK